MSLKYRDSSGTETPVAGLNGTSGELVPSVALMQSGTALITLPSTDGSYAHADITLDTPMPDTDYVVNVCEYNKLANVFVQYKTVNGFAIYAQLVSSADAGATLRVPWQAFKLMTDESRALDESRIEQNTANFAPAFSEVTSYAVGDYVTYNNILYRCTTAHTAGTWVSGHFTQVTVGDEIKSTAISSVSGITVEQQPATIEGCWMARAGNVVQLRIALSEASLTTASATTLRLKLPSSVPKPIMETWGCNDHYNSEADEVAALRFNTEGEMYIFTTKEHSPITGAVVNIGITYITNE